MSLLVIIDNPWFISRFIGNSLWLIALVYYIYISFLGYSGEFLLLQICISIMISSYNSDYQWCSLQLQCCSVAHWYFVLFGDITLSYLQRKIITDISSFTCNVFWSDYFVLEWWCLLNLLMFSLLWYNNLLPLLAMSFPFNTKLKYTFTKFFVQRSIYLSLINVKLMSFKSY